jgi:hypothetical protein
MATFQFVPLNGWPGAKTPASARRRSPWSVTQHRTLRDLDRELESIGARAVVVQTAHEEHQIRRDRMPSSSAKDPAFPGVVLSFTTKHGSYSYPCDAYRDWRANLRAIVLTLERLRAIDRYGVTRNAEQYTGWKALGPAPTSSNGMTPEQAALVVAATCGGVATATEILAGPNQVVERAYRAAAQRLHPDRGGSHEAFVRLQRAYEVLRNAPEGRRT